MAFPPERPKVTLASELADHGWRQLHVAETEKYAHVTYFFNGGEESPYPGEERGLVDSPRDVATYDQKPEMSARAAADAFVAQWGEGDYAFGIINFANADMVGHTGVIEAAVKAVETVDACLGDVVRRSRTRAAPDRHRRPRQRRQHARARRLAQHGALAEPGAADRDRRRRASCATAASWPTWRRPFSRCWGGAAGGDDRRVR